MMTDPIADMLTRIRNAVRVERPYVDMPVSKVKRGVADVLKREGYIWDWQVIEGVPVSQLRIELKYGPNGERVIQKVRRVSKPGRRVYCRAKICARARRHGDHDPQHQPRRGQRPRSPAAETGRRSLV